MAKRKIIQSNPFDGWQPYCRRYIALFDVLSLVNYKGPLAASSLEIFSRLSQLSDAAEIIEHMRGANFGITHEKSATGHLKYFQFSNKVALVTIDNSSESFTVIQMATLALFINAFCLGLPVRGCIALGEVIADVEKNICIGQGFIDAEKALIKQEWFGVIFHSSTQLDEHPGVVRESTNNDIPISIYTEVPITGTTKEEWPEMQIINWPVFMAGASDTLNHLNKIKAVLGLEFTSIYYNTARFINQQLT